MEPKVSHIVSDAMFFPRKERYIVQAADPGVTPCRPGPHKWTVIEQGDIVWWSCDDCSETWCTHPGLDKCYIRGTELTDRSDFTAMTPEERMKVFYTAPIVECNRLTTQRCPCCSLGFCSDHLSAHLEWCGPNGDTIPDEED